MKKLFCLFIVFLLINICVNAQEGPNVVNFSPQSPTTGQAGKLGSMPINIFTGVPVVSVPIYNYNNANSGLSWDVSLSYFAGGTQMLEAPSTVGLGWFLNSTAVVSRTVRGMPDDLPITGYLYAAVIPTDFRSNGDKYYYDSLDAQQDIFQFNVNGNSGSFFIGKDHQVNVVPLSKIKISYTTATVNGMISGFRIITEDGTKYDFTTIETSRISALVNTKSGYANTQYNAAWYLTKIISTFNTDTLSFNYTQTQNSSGYTYPQTAFQRNTDGVVTTSYAPTGTITSSITKINSIVFPDKKTLFFTYTNDYAGSLSDEALSEIKLSDTIFRFGYHLKYKNRDIEDNTIRLLLSNVTPYTATASKKGYTFYYNTPLLASLSQTTDITLNKRDYWGFYNGANNGTNVIPKVNGSSWGAYRNPNLSYTMASTLLSFYLPDGGYTNYEYELNDHYPYIKDPFQLTVQPNTQPSTQNNILLNQVFNTMHQLVFKLDNAVVRTGAAPISGSGNFTINVKSIDGTVLFTSNTFSLYELFYQGIKTFTFNLPNGSYRLETQLTSGTVFSDNFPISISWENKIADNTISASIAGGLRVKRVTRRSGFDEANASVEEYKYINADGKSSGFLGDIPKYDYPYQETVIYNGTTTTAYTAISSDPVNTLNYAQGSPVGYSRVEVIKGTTSNNIGKIVYEFTGLQDVNANITTSAFPYTVQDIRSWGIGLPKKITVYDSSSNRIKTTVNYYGYDSLVFTTANTKSLKLGKSALTYNGNPAISSTPQTSTYLAQEYYPSSGRSFIIATTDTLFQKDGSINTVFKNFSYDANYNLTKTVSSYDINRGLQMETRYYYPYNYNISGAIGSLRDSGIITPVIATENWITGDANPRIVSGGITDYQLLATGHIKPSTVYALESNAPVTQPVIGSFNGALLNRNTTWFKSQTNFTAYDSKANLLQVQSAITGQNNSVIMDYNKQYAIANISNAAQADIAYTSFESDGTGNWTITGTARNNSNNLTGKLSYDLSAGNITKTLNSGVNYLLTVWANTSATVSINGQALTTPLAQQNGWVLYSKSLFNTTSVTISGSGLIDELRLHPKEANMTSQTYDPGIGVVTSVADANNTVTFNEYDALNRIKIVRDKDRNIIKRYDYSDIITSISPVWIPYSYPCRNFTDGVFDSVYIDNNPSSFSYLQTKIVFTGINYCTCSTTTLHPEYKLVNGNCELGTKVFTSSVRQNCHAGDSCTYYWECTWHYEWSDATRSQDFMNSQPYSCGVEP